jgi:hypothetical protein
MDVATIYAARALPRPSLGDDILQLISKLKISFKPAFRRPFHGGRRGGAAGSSSPDNWREAALVDLVRKVREKDDPDYDEISSAINKLSKANYTKLMTDVLERLKKRDEAFRLRVTTLLFDRGVRQTFFATLMADAYKDIAAAQTDALADLATQTSMFDKLYETSNVTIVPSSTDPGYDEAIIAWTKQKEMKRGFAVYVSELYSRGLVPEETMTGFLASVLEELTTSIQSPKTPANEEHVDALVRFLAAVAPKVALKGPIGAVLARPRSDTLSLSMKSRFKLEAAAKQSR